jgi:hypothetical protein
MDSNVAWRIEKDILRWASTGHHHLGTPLTEAFLWDQGNGILKHENRDQGSLIEAMKNLVQRGFAVQAGQGQIGLDGIRIEKGQVWIVLHIDVGNGHCWSNVIVSEIHHRHGSLGPTQETIHLHMPRHLTPGNPRFRPLRHSRPTTHSPRTPAN